MQVLKLVTVSSLPYIITHSLQGSRDMHATFTVQHLQVWSAQQGTHFERNLHQNLIFDERNALICSLFSNDLNLIQGPSIEKRIFSLCNIENSLVDDD